MGRFGMPGCNRESVFNKFFSQSQYVEKFELVWEKHMKTKSIAVYWIDGRLCEETILWADDRDELMYKPISWVDSSNYIPQKNHI